MIFFQLTWYADGFFRVVPELFYQLYAIHGEKDVIVCPCAYMRYKLARVNQSITDYYVTYNFR